MTKEKMCNVPYGNYRRTESAVDELERVRAARDGDETAFADLVRRHSAGLHRAVARIIFDDAEAWDVVQMAFVRAWQRLDRYDSRWRFATWLYRIGTNLAIDVVRSRGSRERAHRAQAEHRLRLVGGVEAPAELADDHDVRRVLDELVQVLTPQQRGAFVLREIEGKDTTEVAAALGCSATTVRNHVFQARKVLRREIEMRYPEYLPASQRD